MPKRIQRKRIKGWRMPRNTFYIGRPTKWGNPFRIGWNPKLAFGLILTANQCLGLYKLHITTANVDIKELEGKNLCCWCPLDQKCHGDILLKVANP